MHTGTPSANGLHVIYATMYFLKKKTFLVDYVRKRTQACFLLFKYENNVLPIVG